jgi:hypothetical protein
VTVESVARDAVVHMTDIDKLKAMSTPDAMASGGVLPQPIPMMEALKLVSGLKTAFPDIKFDIDQVTVNGDVATVKATWSGTNTGPLDLPMPGMTPIPATGKKVSVKDVYILTVKGDKVSHFSVESPADGGIPGAMAQMGVKMPGM